MGCSQSSAPVYDDTQEVEKLMQEAREAETRRFKILLLGAGESGKSTVVKQIKNIHNVVDESNNKQQYVTTLKKNVIEAILTLINASRTLNVPLESSEGQDAANKLCLLDQEAQVSETLAPLVHTIWKDPGIQKVYERRSEYWNMDATPYYLDEVFRIADSNFEPNEEDQLMARVRTTGIVVSHINEDPYKFEVVDVGGQRSERRKWIHCFDDVKSIIFLASLSGYNQVLFEDSTENIMHESLKLFEEIIKNDIFKDTPIFVFLNKKDLFEKLIHTNSLKNCFPEYDGPEGQMQPALEFIKMKFSEIVQRVRPGKQVPQFIIAARVKKEMKDAFFEIKDYLKKSVSNNTNNTFFGNGLFTLRK